MRTIAQEGRCFVLSACQYLTRADCPPSYDIAQGSAPTTVLIRGGSCIVDPFGTVLAEPSFDGEAIRVAELDRRLIPRGKYDLDVVGHYSRPDVFSLSVDTMPKHAVSFSNPTVSSPMTEDMPTSLKAPSKESGNA
jgi:nitrilase